MTSAGYRAAPRALCVAVAAQDKAGSSQRTQQLREESTHPVRCGFSCHSRTTWRITPATSSMLAAPPSWESQAAVSTQ